MSSSSKLDCSSEDSKAKLMEILEKLEDLKARVDADLANVQAGGSTTPGQGQTTEKHDGRILQWEVPEDKFADICLQVGQVVIFQWNDTESKHNVEEVDSQAYETCEGIQKTEGEKSPYTFTATEEGDFYFVCGVGFI